MINLNHQGNATGLYTGSSDEKDASYLLSYLDDVLTPASGRVFHNTKQQCTEATSCIFI